MEASKRAALAYHEAGHAVVNIVGGVVVESVIVTDDESRTNVSGLDELPLKQLPREEYRRQAEPFLLGQLAGGLAEQRFTGSTEDSGADDRLNSAWLAVEICPLDEGLQPYLDRMSSMARDLVEAHWTTIAAVAERLVVQDQVGRIELEALTSV